VPRIAFHLLTTRETYRLMPSTLLRPDPTLPAPQDPSPGTDLPQPPDDVWWGDFVLAAGQVGQWRLGPLSVWVERRPCEWLLATTTSGWSHDPTIGLACPLQTVSERSDDESVLEPSAHAWPAGTAVERKLGCRPDDRLLVSPALADRQVVARPEGLSQVLAGSEVVLYVSTPLWFRLDVVSADGSRPPQRLFERAVIRPADTWFGSDTRHGELCYGVHTPAGLALDEVPNSPARAITRLTITNRAADDLELKRVALPAPNLSLWFDLEHPQRGIFTSSVNLDRSGDGVTTRVQVDPGPPADVVRPQSVAQARSSRSDSFLSRAMSAILT
jgi:hypothetical protein